MKITRTAIVASLLLNCLSAHATSFDCNKGRSVPEQLICHQPVLSSLDDQLGKLYWQARRSVSNPKAFRADSDSKWAWREANCTDEACLKTWYVGRIAELQQLLANLRQGTSARPDEQPEANPAAPEHVITRDPDRRALAQVAPPAQEKAEKADRADTISRIARVEKALKLNPSNSADKADAADKANAADTTDTTVAMQCTAADPGIALHDQCATVLKEDARWQYPAHSGDWFCGVANVPQTSVTQTADGPVVEQ